MRTLLIPIMLAFLFSPLPGFAKKQALPDEGVGITVYNDDFAVVKERRKMAFTRGMNTVKFADVASAIEPASVSFQCLSAPGKIAILEQNYEYDLVNTASLLKRYIDKNVAVTIRGSGADAGRQIDGLLWAAVDNNLILQSHSGKIEIISKDSIENISLAQLNDNLVTKPTLVWLAEADTAGKELCQITYTTGKIGWKADYTAILNAEENALDVSGWVTIDNKSGTTYKDAVIKLIAGDVRRIKPPRHKGRLMYVDKLEMARAGGTGFEEKAFMEYHLYTLGRKSTINNNQVKQIEFITPAMYVPAKKIYLYERSKKTDKVQIKFEFENKKENGLGIALPKGKVRVFKKDAADGMLEFVGEDMIDHTPRKEKIALYIGDAFDIAVEYKLMDSKVSRRMRWEKHRIELRNRKDAPVTVFVDEKFGAWVNWEIEDATGEYEKRDAQTVRFKIKIDADSTATIEYSATQRW